MKAERIQDVLAYAVSFHAELAKFYAGCMVNAENERMKMICKYLVSHENRLQKGLLDYLESAQGSFLNSWVQFSNCPEKFAEMRETMSGSEPSLEKIESLTIELYQCIACQFEQMAGHVDSDEAREIFRAVAAEEKKELKKLGRNFQTFSDI